MNASGKSALLCALLTAFSTGVLAQGAGGAGNTGGGSPSGSSTQTVPNGSGQTGGTGAANGGYGAADTPSTGSGTGSRPSHSTRLGHSNSENYKGGQRPQSGGGAANSGESGQ